MKTRSAKSKGARLQNMVKAIILETFPELRPDDVKPAIMGETGVDIHLSPAAAELFPFSVECKNTEKLSIWQAIKQAEQNTKEDTIPLLIFKRNRSEIYACISLKNFVSLLKKN